MFYLALCVLWQLAAPWLCAIISKHPTSAKYLGWTINIYIVFAVVVHILPESFHIVGWWAIILALVTAVGFWFLEAYYQNENREMSYMVLAVALAGLMLHMAIDGAAIFESDTSHSLQDFHGGHSHQHLAWAIVAHQFPVSLFLWMTLTRYLSTYVSYFWMVVMGLAAIVGYYNSHFLVDHVHPDIAFAMLQAIAGGALIHCVWHPLHVHDAHVHGEDCKHESH